MKVSKSFKNISCYWFACGALALSASAQAPQPPAEFWQYLLEFSDENGELIDPLEFSELDTTPAKQVVEKQDQQSHADDRTATAIKTQDPHPTPAEETLK